MYQESEVVDLMLAVLLTPVLFFGMRSVIVVGKRWFIASYLSILCGYVFTVVEGYTAPDLMNRLEHISYAIAGILIAVAVYLVWRDARQQAAGQPS